VQLFVLISMTRKKIGLALSGGGSRGYAHIGFLKVLAEHNIPVDYIAGTSIGSVVGGALASGMSAAEIESMGKQVRWRNLMRPSFSPIALLSNAPMGRFLEHHFPVSKFEEMKIPFAAVTCDLKTAECVVMKDGGDVITAIRASCAVPAVFAPIKSGGRILVDGGVMVPLPVDAVKEMGADIVIAVDLLSSGATFKTSPATAMGMLFRSAMILLRAASTNQINKPDVLVVPDIAHIRPDRLNQRTDCLQRGEAAARSAIDEIKKVIGDRNSEPLLA
jgi:NTE family protein